MHASVSGEFEDILFPCVTVSKNWQEALFKECLWVEFYSVMNRELGHESEEIQKCLWSKTPLRCRWQGRYIPGSWGLRSLEPTQESAVGTPRAGGQGEGVPT